MHSLSSVLFFFYPLHPLALPVTFYSWCISSEEPEVYYRPRLISDQVSECALEVRLQRSTRLSAGAFSNPVSQMEVRYSSESSFIQLMQVPRPTN
jgi:hypothetical protein